uniref:EamA domain-containing protein n=1 Tax=Haemonchus contortus TaxID=6289 RepID=A0A7I5EDC1_HAECO
VKRDFDNNPTERAKMAWDVCTYAMTAGASGASAAISSKFAFGHYVMEKDFVMFSVTAGIFALSNVLMWWAYTKSLSLAESSIQCLAINMGTNFALTGILGYLFFSETHSILWCIGLSLVFTGICLLATDDKEKTD